MKKAAKLKRLIDIIMTILILVLMAYQITGQLLHEITGTVMIVLFIVHHILNRRWYGNLFKGKYNTNRIYQTIINIGLCIVVILLAYSGIIMSGHVFRFIPGRAGAATARLIHLAASYWGFVLISLHLGNHWGMISKVLYKFEKKIWAVGIVAGLLLALYGAICFIRSDMLSYMFLSHQFVFFDTTQSPVSFFLEYLGIMAFFMIIGYYISKGLQKLSNRRRQE